MGACFRVNTTRLLTRGSDHPWLDFSDSRRRMLGTARRLFVFGIVFVALTVFGSEYYRSVAVTVVITAISAVALTVLMGWVGQPSVLTSAIVLAGGYCAAILGGAASWPFLVVLVASLPIGALLGWLISLPSRRLTGLYQLLATLAFFYIITNLGNQIQSDRGVLGGYVLPPARILGGTVNSYTSWLLISGVVLVLTIEYFIYLRTTRIGRAWVLIRENRDAAEVSGIRVSRFISLAFGLTTGFQFMSGVLLAYEIQTVSYDTVTLVASVSFIVMIVLGGMGSVGGAVVGATVVIAIPPVIEASFGSGSGGGFLISHLTAIEGLIYAVIAAAVLLRLDRRTSIMLRRLRARGAVGSAPLGVAPPETSVMDSVGPTLDDSIGSRHVPMGTQRVVRSSDWIVRLHGISVRYAGADTVLRDVEFSCAASGATALVGRNGAGKTTLLSAIGGFAPSVHAETRGDAWFNSGAGQVLLDGMSPIQRSRLGIALVPAEEKIFGGLTVDEQIREALSVRRSRKRVAAVDDVFDIFPDLRKLHGTRAGLLSGGERQQLAIAVAIAGHARFLLIDEASLGLSPSLVASVIQLLVKIRDEGDTALLIAEQNPHMAFAIANHIVLIEDGAVLDQGAPSSGMMSALEASYLGTKKPRAGLITGSRNGKGGPAWESQ